MPEINARLDRVRNQIAAARVALNNALQTARGAARYAVADLVLALDAVDLARANIYCGDAGEPLPRGGARP